MGVGGLGNTTDGGVKFSAVAGTNGASLAGGLDAKAKVDSVVEDTGDRRLAVSPWQLFFVLPFASVNETSSRTLFRSLQFISTFLSPIVPNSLLTSTPFSTKILSKSEFLYRNIKHSSAFCSFSINKRLRSAERATASSSSSLIYSVRRSRKAAWAARLRCLRCSGVWSWGCVSWDCGEGCESLRCECG